ncbi:hypothetical protein M758_1G190600 [Ceratodon purpureus]|nr:hypothetical protein M758_1G190600 [Ceratodon purpureus]
MLSPKINTRNTLSNHGPHLSHGTEITNHSCTQSLFITSQRDNAHSFPRRRFVTIKSALHNSLHTTKDAFINFTLLPPKPTPRGKRKPSLAGAKNTSESINITPYYCKTSSTTTTTKKNNPKFTTWLMSILVGRNISSNTITIETARYQIEHIRLV